MIEKIGVDISENSRFIDIVKDKKHYEKILSPKCFSAKEALFKACNKKFNFNEVSILNHEDGSPYIEANFLDGYITHVSISHEKAYSIAFVILEQRK